MQQITIALYAEGTTDYRFLPEIIISELEYLLMERNVEYEIFPCLSPIRNPDGSFIERMKYMETEYEQQHLIFIHQDSDSRGNNDVLSTRWQPWSTCAENISKWVPIIPVQMTEAWMLCDRDAICDSLGIEVAQYDAVMNGRQVEMMADPKQKLRQLAQLSDSRSLSSAYELLSSRISRDRLLALNSYKAFVDDLDLALNFVFPGLHF